MASNTCVLPNRTSGLSVIMFQMSVCLIFLCHFGFFIAETSAAQKFYPNGRYGRRSVLPPLMPADSSDDTITFIGNVATNKLSKPNPFNSDQPIALLCYFMGRSDLLKCGLRETATDVLERNNNESQQ